MKEKEVEIVKLINDKESLRDEQREIEVNADSCHTHNGLCGCSIQPVMNIIL